MKNVLFFLTIFLFIGCTSKKNEPKTRKIIGFDAYLYNKAVELAKAAKDENTFNFANAEMYFIAKWNTPSYYCHNSQFTGVSYDGGTILGVEKGDSVYFLYDNDILSDDYIHQTGDSVITVEVRIHKSAVSKDPRRTCWWIAKIQNDEYSNIDDFFDNAVPKPDRDCEQLNPLILNIKSDLVDTKGKTAKQKIINFTKVSIEGSPNEWDAWTWPGYYELGSPSMIDMLANLLGHDGDVAEVPL